MDLKLFEVQNNMIAEVVSDEVVIHSPQDALDLMANAGYQGAEAVLVQESHLSPEFFDLRTGLAVEVMLKFTNYRMKLAIIGEFEKYQSDSLDALIRECNRGKQFFFVADRESAIDRLVL